MLLSFVVIDPKDCFVDIVQAENLVDIYKRVGLNAHEVDHGCLHRYSNGETINIVVYEFGLKKPPEQGRYWAMGQHLFEGGAVIYAANAMGDTVSIKVKPPIIFFRSYVEVEQAISRHQLVRPTMSVNGEVIWKWPDQQR